ncbi:MAG: DUF4349 domain-containing protein, partial [Bacteroidota bacterium]
MRLSARPLLPLVALALALAACQDAAYEGDAVMADDINLIELEGSAGAPAPEAAMDATAGGARGGSTVPVVAVQDTSRRAPVLIRRAELSLRVDDYAEASGAVPGIVDRFDAYLAGEDASQRDRRVSNTFTIRVAAAQFDSLLAELVALADVVEGRNISVDDVTEEYVDVEGRLTARRAVEAQYVTLLARATNVEEVLAVQQALAEVREEIESAEGRLRFLRDRAAMSTIQLTLFETSPTVLSTGPGFFRRAGDAFADGWNGFVDVLVALVALWPLALTVGLAVVGVRRWRRRHPN